MRGVSHRFWEINGSIRETLPGGTPTYTDVNVVCLRRKKTHACGDEGAALTRRPLHCAATLSSASVCSFLAFSSS
ncbi:hypothetical protein E4T96_18280 [Shigella flexneri]|nr:hypothetical protein [Escherichia coli]TFU71779.1 hypothetical protein E4T96_18280 [Shigella flexneri]